MTQLSLTSRLATSPAGSMPIRPTSTPNDQAELSAITERSPAIRAPTGHVRSLVSMTRKLTGTRDLAQWIRDVQASDLTDGAASPTPHQTARRGTHSQAARVDHSDGSFKLAGPAATTPTSGGPRGAPSSPIRPIHPAIADRCRGPPGEEPGGRDPVRTDTNEVSRARLVGRSTQGGEHWHTHDRSQCESLPASGTAKTSLPPSPPGT